MPYSEFKNITLDFQIIIQAAKKETRPTIPPSCPEVLAQLINILWRPKPEDRPDAAILEDMVARAEQVRFSSPVCSLPFLIFSFVELFEKQGGVGGRH